MSFFRPVHLPSASRIRGLWPPRVAACWPSVRGTGHPVGHCHKHGLVSQRGDVAAGLAAVLSWRWLREVLAGLAAEAKMMS